MFGSRCAHVQQPRWHEGEKARRPPRRRVLRRPYSTTVGPGVSREPNPPGALSTGSGGLPYLGSSLRPTVRSSLLSLWRAVGVTLRAHGRCVSDISR